MIFKHRKFWAMLCSFAIAFSTAVSPAGATSLRSDSNLTGGGTVSESKLAERGLNLKEDGTSSDFDGYEFVTWSYVDTDVNNDAIVVFYKYGVDGSLPSDDDDQGTISNSFNSAYHLINKTEPDFFKGDHLDKHYDEQWPAGELNKQYVSGANRYVWKLAQFPGTFSFKNQSGCGYRHVHIYVSQKGYSVEQNQSDYPDYLKQIGEFSDYWSYGGWSSYINFDNFMPKITTISVGGDLAASGANLSKGSTTSYFIGDDLADQYGYNPFVVKYEIVPVSGRYTNLLPGVTINESGIVSVTKEAPDNVQFYVKATITNPYNSNDKIVKTSNIVTINDSVNLDTNGGTLAQGLSTEIELKRGQEITELPSPEKNGYKFLYWKGNDGNIYNNGDIYTGEDDLKTLTAQYEEIIYEVRLTVPADNYKIKNEQNNEINDTIEVSAATGTINLDDYKVCEGSATEESSNFIGWATLEKGKLSKQDGTIEVDGNMTIYGITTDCNNLGLIFVNTDETEAKAPAKNYYASKNAQSGEKVNVTYNDIGDIISGYTYTGYHVDSLNSNNNTSMTLDNFKQEGTSITVNLTDELFEDYNFNVGYITLIWSANDVELHFDDLVDGNVDDDVYEVRNVKYDGQYGSLPTPSRDGYNFLGWYTANSETSSETSYQIREGDTIQDLGTYKPSEGNATLYAKWEKVENISFDPNGGKFVDDGSTQIKTQSLVKAIINGKEQYFYQGKFPEVEKEGYNFKGWYYMIDGSQTDRQASESDMFEPGTELYARWEAITIYVYQKVKDPFCDKTTTVTKLIGTYGNSFGSSKPAASKYTAWVDDLNGTDYCPAGYKFIGWYTEVLDKNNEPTGEEVMIDGSDTINFTDSVNVYAKLVESDSDIEIVNFVNSLYSLEGINLADQSARYGEHYDAQIKMLSSYSKLSLDQKNKLSENLQGVITIIQEALKIKHALAENGILTDSLLDASARLNVTELSLDSEEAEKIKSLTGENILNLWDISLVNVLDNNAEFDLKGDSIRIKIPTSLINEANLNGKKFVHLKSNGQIEYLTPSLEGDYYVIEMSSFSPVAVVTDSANSTDNGLINLTSGKVTTGDSAPMFVLLAFVLSTCTLIVFVISRKRKFN